MVKLSYSQKKTCIKDNLILPIPDGYYDNDMHASAPTWSSIIPEGYPSYSDHIDAKPYSFGIVRIADIDYGYNNSQLDAIEQYFISIGGLPNNILIRRAEITDTIGALYTKSYPTDDDPTAWIKAIGFIISPGNVFQFHVYDNDCDGKQFDEAEQEKFCNLADRWLKKIKPL